VPDRFALSYSKPHLQVRQSASQYSITNLSIASLPSTGMDPRTARKEGGAVDQLCRERLHSADRADGVSLRLGRI
jgi:hypothetical protein